MPLFPIVAAAAGPPDPARCTVSPWDSYHQALVSPGTQSGVDRVTITVRDATNAPCPNVPVEISFSVTTSLCIGVPSGLTGMTNVNGQVVLDPQVGGCQNGAVYVLANATVIRTFNRTVSPDWDGCNASGSCDAVDQAFQAPIFAAAPAGVKSCLDFNGDGNVGLFDSIIASQAIGLHDAQAGCPVVPSPALDDSMISEAGVRYWFNQDPGMGVLQSGNRVHELIDANETFTSMRNEMAAANGPASFIYMLNWFLSTEFPTDGATNAAKLSSVFAAAKARNVMIRAMLWDGRYFQNTWDVRRINLLGPPAAAILDNKTLNFGSHHQKILVVNGANGLVGFCGGIDWNPDRVYPQGVGPNAKGDTGGAPFHDVHCKVEGPAADQLLQIFRERWFDHDSHRLLDRLRGPLRNATAPGPIPGATHWVQIGRTIGNGNAHAGIAGIGPLKSGYGFAPNGEQTAGKMIVDGINKAKKFIYIEDQYFVDTELDQTVAALNVRKALIAAMARPGFEHVTVLIPHSQYVTDYGFPARRKLMIDALRTAGGNKFRVYNLKTALGTHTYVHDKLWIFDDQYAIIGSANCNRRSFTHDSEVVLGVVDQVGEGTPRTWLPHRLRMRLWAEHLGVDLECVRDPGKARDLWLAAGPATRVEAYNTTLNISPPFQTNWDNFYDPVGK